ncbi:MAG: hypothetical protein LE180_01885 [Endomicrobium sp.]|uniref:hypothetical protein n=1 Tax=Candidatus Endomicrobiellum pyrsonymphae TaxID=1408203 RepID=UPI00358BFE32|nr:hypothetical protein [Endomicrobium sp.]
MGFVSKSPGSPGDLEAVCVVVGLINSLFFEAGSSSVWAGVSSSAVFVGVGVGGCSPSSLPPPRLPPPVSAPSCAGAGGEEGEPSTSDSDIRVKPLPLLLLLHEDNTIDNISSTAIVFLSINSNV